MCALCHRLMIRVEIDQVRLIAVEIVFKLIITTVDPQLDALAGVARQLFNEGFPLSVVHGRRQLRDNGKQQLCGGRPRNDAKCQNQQQNSLTAEPFGHGG